MSAGQSLKEQMVANRLQALCPVPLTIVWHENRRSYLSYLKQRALISLRLHRLFLEAPSPVLEALIASMFKKKSPASILVRQMAHLYFSQTRVASSNLQSQGKVYDLNRIYLEVKKDFFPADFEVQIGWSETARVKKFRSMTFGTYDRHRHQIRIHPLLDDTEVPLYFLQFLVYHEMLHAVCPSIIDKRGFCRSHTAEFRRLEKKFPHYIEAKKWERTSLNFFKTRMKGHGRP